MTRVVQIEDISAWDEYIDRNPEANVYQTSHWLGIIEKTYGFKTYCLAIVLDGTRTTTPEQLGGKLLGVLPLVHLKSPLFGNRLVSMPYFDHGGIIAENSDYEEKLMQAVLALGRKLKVQRIELRHLDKIECLKGDSYLCNIDNEAGAGIPYRYRWHLRSHKVRLLLPLPDSSEALMKSFKSKLRSQINRPIKAGLTSKIGGMELLDDFYKVFSINMRDLGSPVHAKGLPRSVMERFSGNAKIVVVYGGDEPIATSLMLGFKDVMINPWASSLRQYSKESPNMMLYWQMLAYAADNGYRFFDFGRSTPEEGTFRFKLQWGAQPQPMYWYTVWLDQSKSKNQVEEEPAEGKMMTFAIKVWQQLPVPITRLIGPYVRKHIDL